MNPSAQIQSDTVKLISLGRASLEKGDAEHSLNAYNVLNNGLQVIANGDPVQGDYTLQCLSLFRIIVKLHQKILNSEKIEKKMEEIFHE